MAELVFSLLGQLQIQHRQLGMITLNNRKAIGLLVYLLCESEHPHSREFLLGLLWPELPTAAAQNNLRVTWAQLQKALGTNGSDEASPLIGDRLSLGFNPLSEHELDVSRFRTLLESCRIHSHHEQQNCAECASRLSEAVNLVRGDFLEEFSLANCLQFEEWLLVKRQYFRLQGIQALEQLSAFYEGTGQLHEAERSIRRLLSHDPLNESAYRQLMRVLARADQRSTALEVYETCRRVLATELGLAPAIETVTLAEQIRSLSRVESYSIQNELPAVLSRFFGRQQESARMVDLLSRRTVRLVTLTGSGGVGKTRLAIELAHQMPGVFARDICLVELAGLDDEDALEDAVAAALHLSGSTGRSSMSIILDYLRDKTLLLVLDNCEHLAKACSRLVKTLCQDAARLTVLATSRIPLNLPEEHVIRLEPFSTPSIDEAKALTAADALSFAAIQLFADRATQSLLPFRLTDANVLAVVRICQQLDGIPLAIEIAAAQSRVMPVEAIAERLSQRFTWLNKQSPENISRQRSLHTLIDWSYGLLSVEERLLFRRLAVFAGGWTLEAAEAIGIAGEANAEILAKLVEHSLVTFGNDEEHRRYSIHETIRQFAQTQLRGSNEEVNVLERHAHYYAQLVSDAAENRAGMSLPDRLRMLRDEHDNLGRAFEWLLVHDREQALALLAQLGTSLKFWELGGFFQEGRRWLQRVLEGTEGLASIQRAQALLAAAELSSAISDFDYGLQAAKQAQELFQQLGDQRGEIDARLLYCDLSRHAGELVQLQKHIEEALKIAENLSYKAGMAKGKQLLAINTVYTTGESAAAIPYELESVALWRELENPFELATALNSLGADLLETGQYAAASQTLLECRNIYQSLGYLRGVALAMHNMGCIAQAIGEYENARELLCESLRIRRDLGLRRGYAYSFEQLAQINELENRYERAVQLLAVAETLRLRIGAPLEQVERKEVEDILMRLRAQIGDIIFELEWAKGAAMSMEQAITVALS